MLWFYDAGYDYGAGIPGSPREIHGFILRKPSEIRDALIASGSVAASAFRGPPPVSKEDLLRVHTRELVSNLGIPGAVAAAIELPEAAMLPADLIRSAIVGPQLLAAGGTYEAIRAATRGEWAINLSGGFHHARRDLSHGFCLINDVAVALSRLRHEGSSPRVLVVDLDLHQGDGNASLFEGDETVFTASLHEECLFPMPKMRSDLDVGLAAGTGDEEYLGSLAEMLAEVRRRLDPELIVYVAGSDPFAGDPLGSLQLSREGLLARDREVARFARELGRPLVVLPAGGYSDESPSIAAAGFLAIAKIEATPT